MRRMLACVVLLAARPRLAEAAIECDPTLDLCQFSLPRGADGGLDYNAPGAPGYNPSKPWVLGGTQVLRLGPGQYTAGSSPTFGTPTIFVAEAATLEIGVADAGVDAGALPEVAFGATLLLCNQGTFRVQNARFRSGADAPSQYPIFAQGQSHIEYRRAAISASRLPAQPGTLTQLMTQASSLAVSGVTFDTQQSLELEVAHSATATIDGLVASGDVFLAGGASLTLSNSQLSALLFQACPGPAFSFDSLPALCGLADGGCGAAAPVSVSKSGPTGSPFALNVVASKLFAWGVITYPGSSVATSNIPADANLVLALNLPQSLDLRLVPGAAPAAAGLTDRTVTFSNTNVFSWNAWPSNGAALVLEPGSQVGDLQPAPPGTTVLGTGTALRYGHVLAPAQTEIDLRDCSLAEEASSTGGALRLTRCTVGAQASLAVGGPVFLADTPLPGAMQFADGGVLHVVALSGAAWSNGALTVTGVVSAADGLGPLAVLPPAHLTVSQGTTTLQRVAVGTAVPDGGVIANLDAGGWSPGVYEATLAFDESNVLIDGGGAVARRSFTLSDADAGTPDAGTPDAGTPDAGTPDAGAPDAGAPDSGAPDAGTPDAGARDGGAPVADAGSPDGGGSTAPPTGCGCSALSGPWLLAVSALLLRRRSRPRPR